MFKPKAFLVLTIVLLLSILLIAGVIWYGSREPQLGGAFTLNHRDQDWALLDNAKRLNLVYVGYVKCPDVCPMTLTYAAQAFKQLTEEQGSSTQLIFISVDVANDTPKDVADYAEQFNPNFIGLTGSQENIARVVQMIGASYLMEKNPGSHLGYSIAHSDRLFFLNKKGFVIDTLPNPRSSEFLTQKIKDNL